MRFTPTLPVADMERAKAWYASVLQLEPVGIDPNGTARYEAGGTRFLVYESQFAGTSKATAMGVEVEDVEATVAELRARGGVFEDYDFGDDFRTVDGILTTPDGQKIAWLKDSEGNILGVSRGSD